MSVASRRILGATVVVAMVFAGLGFLGSCQSSPPADSKATRPVVSPVPPPPPDESAEEILVGPASPAVAGSFLRARSMAVDGIRPRWSPPAQGRDRFANRAPNSVRVTSEDPVSTFSVDVDTASYAFVRNSLMDGVLPQRNAVRVEELVNYFSYDYPLPESKRTPFATSISVLPTPWNDDTQLLHIGIKGFELRPEQPPPANLVFLIDTSGSMGEPDKLPLVISSFKLLLDALSPSDTVSIVTYAGSAGIVLEPTRVAERSVIQAKLERLVALGSTAGGDGLRQAYRLAEQEFVPDGVNRVILATDGDFNVGITDIDELQGFIERKRSGGVLLSVLGFGTGNYNDELMQAMAQNGNGNAAYIDNLMEAQKVLGEEARSTLFPIAKDVKIQVEFNPEMVSEYRLIGYETRLLEREDFRNDKVDAGEIGSGHSVTALYELTLAGSGAERVPPLRYRPNTPRAIDRSAEYAFVKVRYKLPDRDVSELISRAVTKADFGRPQSADSREARFAAAVAGFGQLLRDARYTGDFDYDDVIALAREATGKDEFGYRREFVRLVALAKSAAAMAPLPGDRDSLSVN